MEQKLNQTEQQMTMLATELLFNVELFFFLHPRHETDLWQNQDILSSCQSDKIKRYWVENIGLP